MLVEGLMCSPLLAHLKPEVMKSLAAQCHLRTVVDDEVLCHQHDNAQSLWLVLDGWVKLTRETLDGGDVVWDVLGMGHLVGLETLAGQPQHSTRVQAVGPGSVIVLPLAALKNLLEKDMGFTRALLTHALDQQQQDRLEMEHRSQQTAPQRIGCFLLKLAGAPTQGALDVVLPFDKGLLAARLGMQPETFSRALAKLKQETGLRLQGARVHMEDVHVLHVYTCGGCSGSYPCK